MTKKKLIEVAHIFASHPKLDHGGDIGFLDIDTTVFSDFEGSFDFGDYFHSVFFDYTITEDDIDFLTIEQEIAVCDEKAAVMISYSSGFESVGVSDGENVEISAKYSGQRLMELTVVADGKKSRVVRETDYEGGVAPIFKVVG
jgi:hypothetical protein